MPHSTQTHTIGTIRPATLADLDSLVEILRNARPLDETWKYSFQHRKQFPDDNIKFTKLLLRYYIDPAHDDFHVVVAEAPSLEGLQVTKVVACAIWDVSYRNKRKYGSEYKQQERM